MLARLPLTQNGGTWRSGPMQGVAVDVRDGQIYYAFANLLAQYDFSGKRIGTLVGWSGHMGDIDFNPTDGLEFITRVRPHDRRRDCC